MSTPVNVKSVLDLARYPVDNLGAQATRDLVRTCQLELKETGKCELPGFLSEFGLQELVREAEILDSLAFHSTVIGNAYLNEPSTDLPEDHVARLTDRTALGVIAYDQFPKDSFLKRIFEWDPLMYFVGAVLNLPEIYRYADPMGALNIAVMGHGDYLRWHFDQTDFVTSIAIQTAESGGNFEYVPMIRSAGRECFEDVRKVLKGQHPKIKGIANKPGTFLLFKGRDSIHRVTEISGSKKRYMALLAYDSRPNVTSTDHLRKIRYGRTKPY